MNAKPATKECQECHYRFPITEMKKRIVEKKVGRSGGSASVSPFAGFGHAKKSGRINSGRAYYRRKEEWICNECAAKQPGCLFKFGTLVFGSIIIFVVLLLLAQAT